MGDLRARQASSLRLVPWTIWSSQFGGRTNRKARG